MTWLFWLIIPGGFVVLLLWDRVQKRWGVPSLSELFIVLVLIFLLVLWVGEKLGIG